LNHLTIATLSFSLCGLACSGADTRPAEWGFIAPEVFQPSCATASCHSPAAAAAGLDFSSADTGYVSLTGLWVWLVVPDGGVQPGGVPCSTMAGSLVCEQMLRPLVTPYDPSGSRLINTLRAQNAPRMPPDRPLSEADIELVERWILNGACRHGLTCAGDAAVTVGPGDASADHRGGG